MKNKLRVFLTALFTWCLLNWDLNLARFPWITDWENFIVGVFAAVFVAFITGDLFISQPHVLKHPHRYWHFIFEYIPVFLWEVIKANIDVAYRVIHPQLPINPGIVKVKTSLKTDIALTFLANSITLTPGTMSVDIDKDNGILYIHWIDVKSNEVEEASRIIVEKFETILRKIFD